MEVEDFRKFWWDGMKESGRGKSIGVCMGCRRSRGCICRWVSLAVIFVWT